MTNALDGPRREIRRIFHDGLPQWVSVSDDGSDLLPGDVILTGTPANSRPMSIGDVVEVEATGVGDWWAQRDAERAVSASAAGGH
jgi:hypothetical protein